MMFTGGPFQICFVIVGHKRVYLTLFILYRYYKDLLFVLVSKLYLHGSPVCQGSLLIFLLIDDGYFNTVSWRNWFVLQSLLCA